MQKKGKERGRSWFANSPWMLLIVPIGIFALWMASREPSGISLNYSELKQVLQDPTVSFPKVRFIGKEIRGEIVTRDPVTGSKDENGGEAFLPAYNCLADE